MTRSLVVVIAACGQPALLRRTLQSLAACEKPPEYGGVIVVENGPRWRLADVVAEFPAEQRFAYLYSEPANKSIALNRALLRVGDALVLFTDDDVQVPQHTLAAYARAAAGKDGGEFYGGPILPHYEGEPPPQWLARLLPRSAAGWQMPVQAPCQIAQPEFIGPNFAAFAADVIRVGGFDPQLGPGNHMPSPGEDTEIQERLLAAGIRGYYLPDAPMQHLVRRQAGTLDFAVQRAERNGVYWGISRARQRGFFPRRWLKAYGQWLNDLVRIARWQRRGDIDAGARARCLQARWRGRWQGIRHGWSW